MPHYKDGTEAKVGDIAKGKGYNYPHEVQGVVLAVFPSDTCNLRLAVPQLGKYGQKVDDSPNAFIQANGVVLPLPDGKLYPVTLDVEAGAVQDFELVYRRPEPETARG